MKVLVAGATGALGRAIVVQLQRRGHWVRGLSRRPAPDSLWDDAVVADALIPGALEGAAEGMDAIVSCLGASVSPELGCGRLAYSRHDTPANVALIEEGRRAGVSRFVYVGVASHDTLGHLDYVAAHEAVVDALRASGLSYGVVRPTGFFSAFMPILAMAAKGPAPVIGDPGAQTNPIDDHELAAICVDALEDEGFGERSVGGPEVLTRGRIAELARQIQGKPPAIRRVPAWLVTAMSYLVQVFNPRMGHILRFYAAVGSRDCVAEAHGQRRISEAFAEALYPSGHAGHSEEGHGHP